LQVNDAFLTGNDFPALPSASLSEKKKIALLNGVYPVSNARGECLMVIYSSRHDARWLTLSTHERRDVVALWTQATERSKHLPGCVFTEIFENDGPINSMPHPHGQQYNFGDIPPAISSELARCSAYTDREKRNLFRSLYEAEVDHRTRVVYQNATFISFVPPGARWPFQVRILPRKQILWLTELSGKERNDLEEIITLVRRSYAQFFTSSYQPTIMMTVQQAPFNRADSYYRSIYGFRVEFYNTALSQNAEKLMFSIENSTGYVLYSDPADIIASKLKKVLHQYID
jgi:UDPglucose--hexose-1-phosphate uridylyltransferase